MAGPGADGWGRPPVTGHDALCPECGQQATIGIKVQGTYDGVLIWQCGANHLWPRFGEGRLLDAARDYIDLIEESW